MKQAANNVVQDSTPTQDLPLDKAQQTKGRWMLFVMAVFFIVPIVVVVAMIKLNWRPQGQSYGELVSPARLISIQAPLSNSDGQTLPNVWNEKWNIVYIANECDSACMKRLHDMRQIYVSLYKDMIRVQRVLITQQQDVTAIKKDYPDMLIINQPSAAIVATVQSFNIQENNALNAQRVYFVDPLGHLVMSYPISQKPAYIRKDLVKLLKFSWAG